MLRLRLRPTIVCKNWKHVPKLLGYGQVGQGFYVATSYIEACQKHCWLLLIHYLRPLGLTGVVVHEAVQSSAFQILSQSLWYFCHIMCVLPASTSLCCLCWRVLWYASLFCMNKCIMPKTGLDSAHALATNWIHCLCACDALYVDEQELFNQRCAHLQGKPFDWHSKIHRTLDRQLLAVLDTVHSFGICHRDLHQGNILVTPHKQIILLDFAGANLKSNAEDRTAERNHMAMLLSLRASCHAWLSLCTCMSVIPVTCSNIKAARGCVVRGCGTAQHLLRTGKRSEWHTWIVLCWIMIVQLLQT